MNEGHNQRPNPGVSQGNLPPPPGFPALPHQSAPAIHHGGSTVSPYLQSQSNSMPVATGSGAHGYNQVNLYNTYPPGDQSQHQTQFRMPTPQNQMIPYLGFLQTPERLQGQQYSSPSSPHYDLAHPQGYMVHPQRPQPQQSTVAQSYQPQAQQSPMALSNQPQMPQGQQGPLVQLNQPQMSQNQQSPMAQSYQSQFQPQMPQPQQSTVAQFYQPQPQQSPMAQSNWPHMTQRQQGPMLQSNQHQRMPPPQNHMIQDSQMGSPYNLAHNVIPKETFSNLSPNNQMPHPQTPSPSQQDIRQQNYQPNHQQFGYHPNQQPSQTQMQSNSQQTNHPQTVDEPFEQPLQSQHHPVSHQTNQQQDYHSNLATLPNQMQSPYPQPNKAPYEPHNNMSPSIPPSFDQAREKNLEVVKEIKPDASEFPNTPADGAIDDILNDFSAMSIQDNISSSSKTSMSESQERTDPVLDASMNESTAEMDVEKSSDPLRAGVTSTILVGNLSPGALEENLRNYLEGMIDEDVILVRYTRDHTQAVVTFKNEIDLEQTKPFSKPLEGKTPTVSILEATNQLSVWGVQISSMEKEISSYFRSSRSGNVDRTSIIRIQTLAGVFVLTFQDENAVKKILAQKAHQLDEKTFFVEEFYQKVGAPVWNEGNIETKKCPLQNILATRFLLVTKFSQKSIFKDLRVKTTINEKENEIEFIGPILFVNFACQELLHCSKIMANHNKDIELSRNRVTLLDNELTGEYIMNKMLQREVQGAWRCFKDETRVRLVSTSDDGLRATEDIIRSSLVETEIEAEGITDEQVAKIRHQVETRNLQLYFIIHNQGGAILLVATDDDVESLRNEIQVLNQGRIQRRQEEGMTSILTQSPLKTKYIKLRMQEDLNQIERQHNVTVHAEEKGFTISGERDGCRAAQNDLRTLSDRLKVKKDKMEGPYIKELYKKDLIPFITQYLEQTEDCAAEVSFKVSETVRVAHNISIHLVAGDFPLKSDSVMMTVTENFEPLGSFTQSFHEKGGSQLREELGRYQSQKGCLEVGQVIMTGAGSVPNVHRIFHACFPEIFESMEQEEELVYQAVMRSFVLAENAKMESIAIAIIENEESISFTTREVIKGLAYQLQNRVTNYVKTVFLICQDRVTFEAYSKNSQIFLNLQEEEEDVETPSVLSNQTIDVEVLKGDISRQRMDIIINTVDKSLRLGGGNISKCLLEAGGQSLQEECNRRHPHGIKPGEFAETSGGSLPCTRVYHCCLPLLSSYDTKYLQEFKRLILEVLKHASDSGLRSIAFPSLGTGNRGYSVHIVAKYMFECIRLHKKTCPDTSVNHIRFVIYEKDTAIYQVYKKVESEYKLKSGPIPPGAMAQEEVQPKTYAAAVEGQGDINRWLTPQHQHQHHQQQDKVTSQNTGSIKIKLVIGAIADQQVDVLVNSVDPGLNLGNGAVSASILRKGGSDIFKEVKARYSHVQSGFFVESNGGRLSCKKIYHSCLPGWGTLIGGGCVALLTSLITKCLHQAGKDGYSSIAFPAFGTGNLGYPKDQVAEAMYKAVAHFSQNYSYRFADVLFVVYEKDRETISAFEKRHAVYETAMQSPSSQETKEWEMKNLKIIAKQGDILTEACDTLVVPVARSFNLAEATVSGNLQKTERGVKLQSNCYESGEKLSKHGWVMIDSNNTCAARMLFFVNKDHIQSDQKFVLRKLLQVNDKRGFSRLALPVLATGRDPRLAADLAKDLFSVLKTSDSPKNVKQITVVLYKQEQFAAFKEGFSDAFYTPLRKAPLPPTHQQVVHKPREPSQQAGAVGPSGLYKEPQVVSSARVQYRVASLGPECLRRAMETLRYLNTEDKDFCQKISISGLHIDRNLQREFTGLGTDSVKVILKKQEKGIVIEGESLEALQVLRNVMTKISELRKSKTKPTKLVLTPPENAQEPARYSDTASASLNPDERRVTNKDGAMPANKIDNDASPKGTPQESEQEQVTYRDTASASLVPGRTAVNNEDEAKPATKTGYGDETTSSPVKNSEKHDYDTAKKGNFSSGGAINNQQIEASTSLKVMTHKGLPDDDTWIDMEMDEIHDMDSEDSMNNNPAEMNTVSPQMKLFPTKTDSFNTQTDTVMHPMDSYSDQKDTKSPDMDSNSSQTNTEEHQMTNSNSAESTDAPAKEEDTGTDTKKEWFFVNDTESGRELQSYDPMTEKIESMYLRGDPSVLLPGEDEEYVIEFSTMEEFVKGSEEDRVSVVRREILPECDVVLPAELKDLSSNSKLLLVDRTSEEFDRISSQFLQASKDIKVTVVKIEKMLNISVYQSYQRKKKWIMESSALTEGDHVERSLWQGPLVNTDSIVNLSSFGFNRSYCTSGRDTTCGEGVYFYPFITDILDRSKMDASGHHHVCLAKVLTGRLEANTATLFAGRRRLPKGSHSVVDNMAMPSKFVIFYDNQALPEYLVTFSADKDGQ